MTKVSTIFISLLVFSGIATGLTLFYNDLSSTYGVTVSADQNLSTLSRAAELGNFTEQLRTQVQSGGGLLTTVFFGIGLVWGVIAQILLLPFIIISIINDLLLFLPFPVPGWFALLVLGVPTAVIMFKIISYFTNREV